MKKFIIRLLATLGVKFTSILLTLAERRIRLRNQQLEEVFRLIKDGKAELTYDESTKKIILKMK